jgi:hypothetical protein
VIAVGQHQLTGTIFCPGYLLVADGHVQVRLQGSSARRERLHDMEISASRRPVASGPGIRPGANSRTAEQQNSRKAEKQKSRKAEKQKSRKAEKQIKRGVAH